MIRIYNKLIRDKMPEIITQNGNSALIRTITNDDEYRYWLHKKLEEEVNEYLASKSLEELGDVLDTLRALYNVIDFNQLMKLREAKLEERGGFEGRKFMVLAEINNPEPVNE